MSSRLSARVFSIAMLFTLFGLVSARAATIDPLTTFAQYSVLMSGNVVNYNGPNATLAVVPAGTAITFDFLVANSYGQAGTPIPATLTVNGNGDTSSPTA